MKDQMDPEVLTTEVLFVSPFLSRNTQGNM